MNFKDLPIGTWFQGWGDVFSNYDHPAWITLIKTGAESAQEVNENGTMGQGVCMNVNDTITHALPLAQPPKYHLSFELALRRPLNYESLPKAAQDTIDRNMGIEGWNTGLIEDERNAYLRLRGERTGHVLACA